MVETKNEKSKKVMIGKVISDKMDKTIVVRVERTSSDLNYKKVMRSFKKYKVHDANENAKTGDIVEFFEGRPLSKTKYMYLSKIIKSNNALE